MAMNLENANIIEVNSVEKQTDQPSYFSVIPANVRYDSDLSPYAILLYGEITALTHKNGYCYASNTYFAKRYDRTPQAVSKWINQLASKGYINIVYCRCKNIIVERRIYITSEVSTTVDRVSTPVDEGINQELIGYQQTIKENNKSNNKLNNKSSSTSLNSEPPKFKAPKMTKAEENDLFLSSLTKEEYNLSEKCADLMIDYLKPITKTYDPAIHKKTWQVDFVRRSRDKNVSLSDVLLCVQYVHDDYTGFEQPINQSPEKLFKKFDYLYGKAVSRPKRFNTNKNVDNINKTCNREDYDTAIF